MEASNYYSTHNNSVEFPQSSDTGKNEEPEQSCMSLNRRIVVCDNHAVLIGTIALPNHAESEQKRFLTTTHIQPAISSNQFRAELEQIKAWLDDGCLKSVEDCQAQLKSIIEANVGVYRYKEDQSILFHVEENDSVKGVKRLFDHIVSNIRILFTFSNCSNKSKIELMLLVCRHYNTRELIPILEELLNGFDESDNEYIGSLPESIKIYETLFQEIFPVYLAFDLLLNGHFNTSSGLYYILGETFRDIGTQFPPPKWKLKFEFDNSINVQMIWALLSILNYWDTGQGNLLNSFAGAIYDRQGIDLHKDDDLIKYIAMRMDTADFQKLLRDLNDISLMEKIEEIHKEKVCENFSFPEKLIFMLKRLSRSDYFKDKAGRIDYFKEKAGSLFIYLKRNSPKYKIYSEFVMLLQKSPVRALSEVEECMDKMIKMADEGFLELKKQELSEILELIKGQTARECKEKIIALTEIKMNLMADINALKLGIEKDIAKFIIDPITLEIIEHAVITPYGHSFDQESITRWLKENNSCPITGEPLELKQLSPYFSLQGIIDDLSPKLKKLKADTDSIDTNQSD
ncbi:U-box domain-containing protein [Endozoicomonas sp. YOMI1]|uniref:U-box domain-containing protein n=1 Tax=Endozoicomonas sp. YOMI1 TaxID=2828739 RepID=UPI002147F55F|nr:U-box domain-containing protein [Endozoicomonas sp. YOMI1]